ncbi:MAG: ATP-dependent sacrificial sulfur transferase LarE [Planctomycetota bacterium]|jgi:uncharacterized protein
MTQRIEIPNTAEQAEHLVQRIAEYPSCVVAFSGGVDSAVVAAAAYRALGDRAVAWTGIGPAVPQSDRDDAVSVATAIGIRHEQVETREIDNPSYVRNGPDRCYHCKTTLFETMRAWADQHGFHAIASGTNHDDLGDYRPGLRAAEQWRVVAPLAELRIGKSEVRGIAQYWGLCVADKPASPCLASRIAYGQIVTLGSLTSIDTVERWLREHGFADVRARVHADGLLRIELQPSDWARFLSGSIREDCLAVALAQGFQFVTLDILGRSSGSLNRVLQLGETTTSLQPRQ